MNPHFQFWWRWLLVMTVGLMIFGVSFFVLPGFMQQVYNALFFSTSQVHTTFNEAASAYIRFIYVVLGAVMFGWALSLLFTLAGPFKLGHLASWWAVVASVATWFVIDSVLSVIDGLLAKCGYQHRPFCFVCHSLDRHTRAFSIGQPSSGRLKMDNPTRLSHIACGITGWDNIAA